jgi:hypothetical protein
LPEIAKGEQGASLRYGKVDASFPERPCANEKTKRGGTRCKDIALWRPESTAQKGLSVLTQELLRPECCSACRRADRGTIHRALSKDSPFQRTSPARRGTCSLTPPPTHPTMCPTGGEAGPLIAARRFPDALENSGWPRLASPDPSAERASAPAFVLSCQPCCLSDKVKPSRARRQASRYYSSP